MINQMEQTLYRLANLNAEQSRVTYQTSTGKILENGSDDSTLYGREVFIDDKIRTYEGIKDQIDRSIVQNNSADSTISEMKKLFEVAKTELIKANTDTTSDQNKESIALSIEGIKDNIYNLVNTQIEDQYLFSGSDSSIKPFTENTDGSIDYNGNNSYKKVVVDDGRYRERGVNGFDVMTYPSSIALSGETLNFNEDDTIIDQEGSIWQLNAGNTEIEKLNSDGSVDTSVASKAVTAAVAPDEGFNVVMDATSGTKFEARTSIFDLLDDMINTLNKVDSDGNALDDATRDELLGSVQDSFSDAYDSLNVAHANLGAKNEMFEVSLSNISSKLTEYNILSQEVGASDLTKLALESKSLEITYTALYSTIQKTNELSLINFIK